MGGNTPTPITGGVGFAVKAAVPHNWGARLAGLPGAIVFPLRGKVDPRRADG